jgi:UDP-N-acetylmuramate dehydrogenase|tara:strand:+ start:801 stop:1820 length:1020 start_codon:yes stop_codon:yes gene_type:complete
LRKKIKISLKNFNSFGVDAISSDFNVANSEQEIIEYLNEIKFSNPIILGGGTNILFKSNIDKSLLKIEIKGIEIINETNNYVDVSVGAGEIWDNLVNWSIEKNYGGLENLSFIPGNVGSAPIQNIGAYGVELKDTFLQCRAISIDSGLLRIFEQKECDFSYRSSIFKEELKNKYIISNVTFRLSKINHKINFSYEPLKIDLKNKSISSPTIKDISKSVIEIRSSKLPDPKVIGNCGSFFKNPIINKIDFKKLLENENDVPFFDISENEIKIPAAWLIEKCGFKGLKVGNTGVHKKHALIIISNGKATGKEIFDFSQRIKNEVLRKFNILLEEEVNIIDN